MAYSFLPGVPADPVLAAFAASPGNEIDSGKFRSQESSSALAANTFGYFLERPGDLPVIPGISFEGPTLSVALEAEMRFPWTGGRHPWLDAAVRTDDLLIGIESKRFEPYRSKSKPSLSEAYWRDVWGDRMAGYQSVRDGLRDGSLAPRHLDAAQLVKHGLGLLASAARHDPPLRPVLIYLYAEPKTWPDGRKVSEAAMATHRAEVAAFAEAVAGNAVVFHALSYDALLAKWEETGGEVAAHAARVRQAFGL